MNVQTKNKIQNCNKKLYWKEVFARGNYIRTNKVEMAIQPNLNGVGFGHQFWVSGQVWDYFRSPWAASRQVRNLLSKPRDCLVCEYDIMSYSNLVG